MFFDELLEKALVAFEDGTQHPAVGVDAFPHRFGREIGSAVFAVEQQCQQLREDLKNPAAIVDANHSNSNKQFREQIRIVSEVLHSRRYNTELKQLIKGVMIESYLEEGCQKIDEHRIYGKSITDPCLGWDDTERLIYKIAEEC